MCLTQNTILPCQAGCNLLEETPISLGNGRLGELLAPRPDFDNEVTSLLKAGLFEDALTLLKKQEEKSSDLNRLDRSGLALIHIACASGAMEFLVELISLGAEISLPASSGSTALHFAAVNNRKGIIEVLLRSGADPSIPNESGLLASELTSKADIRILLSREPSQTRSGSLYGHNLSAMNQARQGLKAYAESNESTGNQTTTRKALNIEFERMSLSDDTQKVSSQQAEHPETSSSFLDVSSPITMERIGPAEPASESILESAVQMSSSGYQVSSNGYLFDTDEDVELRHDLQQAVLKAAKDFAISTQDSRGQEGRRKIVLYCQNTSTFDRNINEFTQWLLFDPSLATCRPDELVSRGHDGYTPLHVAAKYNNVKALELLLQCKGVSAWIVDLQGRTPLHVAAGMGHQEACNFLREKMQEESNGRINPIGPQAPVDLNGYTPVGWAAHCKLGNPSPGIKSSLYMAGDRTVLPLTPIRHRVGTSPRRGRERVDVLSGSRTEELVFAFSVAQGWKPEMEDRVVTISPVSNKAHWSFFAVFDGHGGDFVVNYLSHNINRILTSTIRSLELEIGIIGEDASSEVLETILKRSCATADLEISRLPRMLVVNGTAKDVSGSTGLMCLITKTAIAVANVGDSRALLAQWDVSAERGVGGIAVSTPGSTGNPDPSESVLLAVPLSVDHKFSITVERDRALTAGAIVGIIVEEGMDPNAPHEYEVYMARRSDLKLRMSRSFGDFCLKQNLNLPSDQQAVIAVPDVVIRPRSISDVFVLLACDGVYDFMDNQEIVDLLASILGYTASGGPLPSMSDCAQACDCLLEECLNRGAVDNLSALLIMCGVDSSRVREPTAQHTAGAADRLSRLYPESSLKSPEGSNMPLGSPSSGAKDRTPTDKTLSLVFSTEEPDDQSGTDKSVNRHLEFARDLR